MVSPFHTATRAGWILAALGLFPAFALPRLGLSCSRVVVAFTRRALNLATLQTAEYCGRTTRSSNSQRLVVYMRLAVPIIVAWDGRGM
jgi:hypothetical protein